jgi:hypothetical protein
MASGRLTLPLAAPKRRRMRIRGDRLGQALITIVITAK